MVSIVVEGAEGNERMKNDELRTAQTACEGNQHRRSVLRFVRRDGRILSGILPLSSRSCCCRACVRAVVVAAGLHVVSLLSCCVCRALRLDRVASPRRRVCLPRVCRSPRPHRYGWERAATTTERNMTRAHSKEAHGTNRRRASKAQTLSLTGVHIATQRT